MPSIHPSWPTLASIAGATILFMAGCSDHHGSSNPQPNESSDPQLSGLVATGAAVAHASVQVKCSDGSAFDGTTNDTGHYQNLSIPAQALPCALEAAGGTPGLDPPLHSYLETGNSVNITPLTDLIVAASAGGQTPDEWFAGFGAGSALDVANAPDALKAALAGAGYAVPDGNPLNVAFSVGDAWDTVLDDLAAGLAAAGSTHAQLIEVVKDGNLASGSFPTNPSPPTPNDPDDGNAGNGNAGTGTDIGNGNTITFTYSEPANGGTVTLTNVIYAVTNGMNGKTGPEARIQADDTDKRMFFTIFKVPRHTGTFDCSLGDEGVGSISYTSLAVNPPTFVADSGAEACSVTVTKFVRGDGLDMGKSGDHIEGTFTVNSPSDGVRINQGSFSVTAPSDGRDPNRVTPPTGEAPISTNSASFTGPDGNSLSSGSTTLDKVQWTVAHADQEDAFGVLALTIGQGSGSSSDAFTITFSSSGAEGGIPRRNGTTDCGPGVLTALGAELRPTKSWALVDQSACSITISNFVKGANNDPGAAPFFLNTSTGDSFDVTFSATLKSSKEADWTTTGTAHVRP